MGCILKLIDTNGYWLLACIGPLVHGWAVLKPRCILVLQFFICVHEFYFEYESLVGPSILTVFVKD